MPAPLIEFKGISKKFGSRYANRDIQLAVEHGQIHALAGENGAGKTTLMNILFGRVRPDSGSVILRGKPVAPRTPRDAIRAGIGMVHQKLLYCPQLSVLENVILGSEPSKAGIVQTGRARAEFFRMRDTFGFNIDPDISAGDLPFAGRQQMELLRMLYRGADILILDEPTTFLAPHEVQNLLGLLRSLRSGGRTILFISHRLDEVFATADRITVLRHGSVAATLDACATSKTEIAQLMVAAGPERGTNHITRKSREFAQDTLLEHAELQDEVPRERTPSSALHFPATLLPPLLEVRDICVAASGGEPEIDKLSFCVDPGEIFGIGGIVGNGLSLLARALAGRVSVRSGSILFDGTDITALSLEDRLEAGIRRVPEDPSREALLPQNPVWENFLLGRQRQPRFQRMGITLKSEAVRFTSDLVRENAIATGSPFESVSSLSGGNQQKVALAAALSGPPRLAILEQPSRGLDLHAAGRMREKIFALSTGGTAIIVFSYNLDELLALCRRVAIIYRGKLAGPVKSEETSRETLGKWMAGLRCGNDQT